MMTIPRLRFAHLPTPIESMPRLARVLGLSHLYVKRDDQTGLAFGGNKTRKLEFLVAEAQEQGARTLVTAGALQSNHCRQTAAAAARFGFDCILVLTGSPPEHPTANLLLDDLFGAQIIFAGGRENRPRVLDDTFTQAKQVGKKPYLVPYGGSSPTGALGYVYAVQELVAQKPDFDWILFASSSGGTQAGLTLGARMFGFTGNILGISVDEPRQDLQAHVAELASCTAIEKFGTQESFPQDGIQVNDDYSMSGYGVLTENEKEAVRLFARTEGLLLDPVYTGRAAGGMIDLARKRFFKTGESILFWHTGGQPALFAEAYQDI
jgi:D-cysteine desulfhydrase family pyridoxal phosphate-dependent enzyme